MRQLEDRLVLAESRSMAAERAAMAAAQVRREGGRQYGALRKQSPTDEPRGYLLGGVPRTCLKSAFTPLTRCMHGTLLLHRTAAAAHQQPSCGGCLPAAHNQRHARGSS